MMYSDYVKQRILFYRRLGKSCVQISRRVRNNESRVYKFVKRYKERGIISHSPCNISYIVQSGASIRIYFCGKYTSVLRASVDTGVHIYLRLRKYQNGINRGSDRLIKLQKSCQGAELKLQQWGNAKDDVRNARRLHNHAIPQSSTMNDICLLNESTV